MEIQDINTKLERKGLFREIFQNVSKQSFPKSDSKPIKQNGSLSSYNIKENALANTESQLKNPEKAKTQFEDSSVLDKQTKLRLQEVLSHHKSNLMKQKLSATLMKIDSSMPNLARETSRDSYDQGVKKSSSQQSTSILKGEPSQTTQLTKLTQTEENFDQFRRISLLRHLAPQSNDDKKQEDPSIKYSEGSEEANSSESKFESKFGDFSHAIRKSFFAHANKPPDSSSSESFGPNAKSNTGSSHPKHFVESRQSASKVNNLMGSPGINKRGLLISDEPESPAKFADHEKTFSHSKNKRRKEKMYLFFNAPHSSTWALFYNIMVLMLYVAESSIIVLETEKSLNLPSNLWIITTKYFLIFYILEYLLRFSCYNAFDESFWEYFKTINFIDLLAIIYTSFEIIYFKLGNYEQMPQQIKMFRALTMLRWIRGFRFSIFNRGRKILSEGLSQSKKPLTILAFFALLTVICFASLMFTIEANSLQNVDKSNYDTEPIDTIPQAMWWAITTVTTVGYGDTIPLTFGGKFLSLYALLFGVILISLPVAIMGNKFQDVYLSHKNIMTKKQRKQMKERVDDPQISKEEKEIFKIIVMLNELEEINENIEKHLRNNKFLYRSITRDSLNLISKIELTNKASLQQQITGNKPEEILASIRRKKSKRRKASSSPINEK